MMRIDLPQPLRAAGSRSSSASTGTTTSTTRSASAGAQRLRALPGGRQRHLRDRAVVPAPGRLHRRQRLAAQAVPRVGRVHARVRRLPGAHHRARRSRRRRHRRAAEPRRGADAGAARAPARRPRPPTTPVLDRHARRGASENEKEKRDGQEDLGLQGRERARLRLRHRRASSSGTRRGTWSTGTSARDGDVLLSRTRATRCGSKYSTAADHPHARTSTRATRFAYPYPVAISVNGPVGGMEYPMICFNGPRPEKDGTYSARTKYGLISVVIHEVGPQLLPDDRQLRRAPVDLDGRGPEHLPAVPRRAASGRTTIPRAAASRADIVDYMQSSDAGPDHDQLGVGAAVRQQRLRQAGDGAQHPARDDPGPRAVRLRVQGVRAALEVQAAEARRLLPHDGGRLGRRPRLVLARLVLHDRPRRPGASTA